MSAEVDVPFKCAVNSFPIETLVVGANFSSALVLDEGGTPLWTGLADGYAGPLPCFLQTVEDDSPQFRPLGGITTTEPVTLGGKTGVFRDGLFVEG